MPERPRRRVGALTTLAIVAAACSGAAGPVGVSPDSDPPAVTGSVASGPTPDVLRFSAPRLDGGTVRGEDYSGRDVAFWFWAPW